jgi:hypothetical protein
MSNDFIGSEPVFSIEKSSEKGWFTVANEGQPERLRLIYQLPAEAASAAKDSIVEQTAKRFIRF